MTQTLFVPREEKMNAVLLITVLVVVVGGNTAVGLAPCERTASNNAYNNFLRKHVLRDAFNTNSKSEWKRYLRKLDLCDRPRQSFVGSGDQGHFVEICNGNGKLQNDNLCTGTSRVWLYDLRVRRDRSCTVINISQRFTYVTVACDKVDNLCRPVHFEGSQNNRPSSMAPTCGSRANHWFQI